MMMTLVLSQIIGMGWSYITCATCKFYFIHSNCVQQEDATIYYTSTVGREIVTFFFLKYEIINSLRKKTPPPVLFQSTTSPSQSTLVKIVSEKYLPLGYWSPYSIVAIRYLRILLPTRRWLCLVVSLNIPTIPNTSITFGLNVVKYKRLPMIDLYKFLSHSRDSLVLLIFHLVNIGVLTK